MICPICLKNHAYLSLKRTVNGIDREIKVCRDCYSVALGMPSPRFFRLAVDDLKDKCPFCDMTFGEYIKTEKLGCPHCYTHFAQKLAPYFESVKSK